MPHLHVPRTATADRLSPGLWRWVPPPATCAATTTHSMEAAGHLSVVGAQGELAQRVTGTYARVARDEPGKACGLWPRVAEGWVACCPRPRGCSSHPAPGNTLSRQAGPGSNGLRTAVGPPRRAESQVPPRSPRPGPRHAKASFCTTCAPTGAWDRRCLGTAAGLCAMIALSTPSRYWHRGKMTVGPSPTSGCSLAWPRQCAGPARVG